MKKILFLIHDLGHGGAEKVLVNLVNHLDRKKFDITVTALFGGGVNEQYLAPDIKFHVVFKKTIPGNSHIMKLFTPEQLHRYCVKERYDIEVSYLEGPSARIISGCPHGDTKLVSWIHCTMHTREELSRSFRGYAEAAQCYSRFHQSVFVSNTVREAFLKVCPLREKTAICYNTNDTERILAAKMEPLDDLPAAGEDCIRIFAVGKLAPVKGFDRMVRIHKRLRDEGYPVHTCILGEGPEREALTKAIHENQICGSFTLLGYRANPYKYVAAGDLFVCSSHAEGFSTAATEALIVGTPVCTAEVSGMKEMLGEHNEWGIVTENDEEAIYQGIKGLLDDPALLAHYKKQAQLRGKAFSTENTVKAVETMLLEL